MAHQRPRELLQERLVICRAARRGLVRQIDANTLWVGTALAAAGRELASGITAQGSIRFVGAEAPVVVQRMDDSLVAVTVRYTASAQQVHIVGEWNGWRTTPMHAIGADQWRAVLPIPPGIHEFSLVVDEDEWTVPDGAVLVPDEFGGQVAVLVVPREVSRE